MRILCTLFVFIACASAAQALNIRGVVTENSHKCEVDGICAFHVKTREGRIIDVIYGREEPFPAGCEVKDTKTAWALKKGQTVDVNVSDKFKETDRNGQDRYFLCVDPVSNAGQP